MHQTVGGWGSLGPFRIRVDHDFAGRKTFADQDMTDETFAGHFIRPEFYNFHEGKGLLSECPHYGRVRSAVADVDDIVRMAGV